MEHDAKGTGDSAPSANRAHTVINPQDSCVHTILCAEQQALSTHSLCAAPRILRRDAIEVGQTAVARRAAAVPPPLWDRVPTHVAPLPI
jgi:hypothetical protein